MSYQRFSSGRQGRRLRGTILHRHLPEAVRPNHPTRSCFPETPAALLAERGRHHNHAPALRHRRIPEEHEVADPEERDAPEEEDAPEEVESSEPEAPGAKWLRSGKRQEVHLHQ